MSHRDFSFVQQSLHISPTLYGVSHKTSDHFANDVEDRREAIALVTKKPTERSRPDPYPQIQIQPQTSEIKFSSLYYVIVKSNSSLRSPPPIPFNPLSRLAFLDFSCSLPISAVKFDSSLDHAFFHPFLSVFFQKSRSCVKSICSLERQGKSGDLGKGRAFFVTYFFAFLVAQCPGILVISGFFALFLASPYALPFPRLWLPCIKKERANPGF